MTDVDARIANLQERVDRLEAREREMTEIFRLVDKLHDADTARADALSSEVEILGQMLCLHLGLPDPSTATSGGGEVSG